jgi:hypothetical protein
VRDVAKVKTFFFDNRPHDFQSSLKWDSAQFQGVDILLTSDWPKGVSNRTAARPQWDDLGNAGHLRLFQYSVVEQ